MPLKRLRTRLSIPLGLRHAASTHLKRSLWWRMKRLVPANRHARQHSRSEKSHRRLEIRHLGGRRCEGLVRWSGGSIGGKRGLEERTLLHDRDVLLGGNHLCGLLERRVIGDMKIIMTAKRVVFTLTVLLSGDGRIRRRHGRDLPWEKFQNLVELVGLGLCENC